MQNKTLIQENYYVFTCMQVYIRLNKCIYYVGSISNCMYISKLLHSLKTTLYVVKMYVSSVSRSICQYSELTLLPCTMNCMSSQAIHIEVWGIKGSLPILKTRWATPNTRVPPTTNNYEGTKASRLTSSHPSIMPQTPPKG